MKIMKSVTKIKVNTNVLLGKLHAKNILNLAKNFTNRLDVPGK